MSNDDDTFSTRKVGSEEMDRLRDLLDKVEKVPEVTIIISADLYARVDAVKGLCSLDDVDGEEAEFVEAVNQIFEAGLREYEARQAME